METNVQRNLRAIDDLVRGQLYQGVTPIGREYYLRGGMTRMEFASRLRELCDQLDPPESEGCDD